MTVPSDTRETSETSSGDILVIDDTPDNLRFLSSLLTEAGYTVRKVINGALGLEAAQLQPPDLILLDIVMPGMNGYEVCQRMKASDRTHDIPIIFLSALDEELEKVQAFQTGGVDYVTKPFQVVEVLARIETHLKISRLQQQLQQQNLRLQQEIAYRTSAEAALQLLNQGLDAHVQSQTAELVAKYERLSTRYQELTIVLEQTENQNQIQTQTIETLGQDLRSQLTAITSAIDQLKRTRPDSLDHKHIEQIASSVEQMEQWISNALTRAALSYQQPDFHPVPLDLEQFCRNIVNQWHLPENSPHCLNFLSISQTPVQVSADPDLLQQLLSQLISNAIRFSPQGGTALLKLQTTPDDAPTHAILHVQDNGIGIPPEETTLIFDRFYCASNAGEFSGAGIGLTKVKQIVERHRGTITVASTLGKGTTCTVTLPL
ncbi:hybrid sensor histidine kinase/response regulator [Egbenema bharatensis]|uniref:hybrid sensor histidine kinase/response regulator n=1 Tax=Egbenema bharatensis TaxID=3463334 RepID=UPI003A876710